MGKFLVTATPPTPNGDLHVGHLSGPFLAADVFSRFQRLRGDDVAYLSSGDDHQSYVLTTAERVGRDPVELLEAFNGSIQETLRAASIELDRYATALGNEAHVRFAEDFFRLLIERELVVAKERDSLWCDSCQRFLFESFVHGACPYCGESASGNLCEACGRVNDPCDLADAECGLCGTVPERRAIETFFFPLEPHRAELERFYSERTSWRPHLMALCEALLAEPLPDYPASYPTPWGIRVPAAGFEDQAINVWLEMYPGHVLAGREWYEAAGAAGASGHRLGDDVTLVQFLGYDNSFFNAVLHTAMALALGDGWPVPEHIVTNEFYFLEGEKFSTSRDHAIWGRDILAEVPADALRYHLCRTNPEHWQTQFSRSDLATTVGELEGMWEPTVARLAGLAENAGRDQPPSDLMVRGLIGWAAAKLNRFYGVEEFSLRAAATTLREYVEAAGEYAERANPSGPAAETLPGDARALLRALAAFASPIVPGLAQRIWTELGLEGAPTGEAFDPAGARADRPAALDSVPTG